MKGKKPQPKDKIASLQDAFDTLAHEVMRLQGQVIRIADYLLEQQHQKKKQEKK